MRCILFLAWRQLVHLTTILSHVCSLSADGNLCWWWSQAHLAWSCSGEPLATSLESNLFILFGYFLFWLVKIRMQHYIKLSEQEKNRKLNDLLDALDFNQVVIFVKSVTRAAELNKLLCECNFPSICIHSGMPQEERLESLLCIFSSLKLTSCLLSEYNT